MEQFVAPFGPETQFYNPYNTALFAVLFGLGVLYIGLPLIRRLEVEIDRSFFTALAPYVFFGGALRSMEDAGTVTGLAFQAPGIFFTMFGLVAVLLVVSRGLERASGIEYWKPLFAFGMVLLSAAIGTFSLENAAALGSAALIFGSAAYVVYYGTELFLPSHASAGFQLPVIAHYFDATTSVVSIANGGTEKHVLASIFIDLMGPAGMFVMKTAVIVPATWYLFHETDGDTRNFLLFVIALLGFALGTRNLLSTVGI